jgi:hypothetical protein
VYTYPKPFGAIEMSVDLNSLLGRYKNIKDFGSAVAIFRTNTPHRAPFAYLHILYKPASPELQAVRCRQLRIPQQLAEFYAHHNGADMFGGTISIFGFRPDHYLLNRRDWKNLPPLDIVEINEEYKGELDARNLVCFAYYDVDGSHVCAERDSGQIKCFVGKSFGKERRSWPNLDEWIRGEIDRLSLCFDELGRQLVEDEQLLPNTTALL